MAIIQNSAIIQKLVDELELYPALDKIPTELAEKIIPTFQVNTQKINVQEGDFFEGRDIVANDSDKSIVVPDNERWKILSLGVHYTASADVGNRTLVVEILDAAGNIMAAYQMAFNMAASSVHQINFKEHSDDWTLKDLGGSYGRTIDTPFDFPLVLLERQSIRIFDVETIAAAADDMIFNYTYIKAEV